MEASGSLQAMSALSALSRICKTITVKLLLCYTLQAAYRNLPYGRGPILRLLG